MNKISPLILTLFLLQPIAFADVGGVDFSMQSTVPIRVEENQRRIGATMYSELIYCICVMVNNEVMIHIYPRNLPLSKKETLDHLINFIGRGDKVYVVGSHESHFKDDIAVEDIIEYAKDKGVRDKDITSYTKPMSAFYRYVVFSNMTVAVIDSDKEIFSNVGSVVYASSIPIGVK